MSLRRARVTAPVDHLDGLAELGQRGGLPGPGRTGHHQAAPPVVGVLVQLDQPAAGVDDLADHGGLDHQQPGVVVDAVIVVAGAFARFQARPDRLGQQVRHRGHLGDEAAPARQGGQLQMLVLTGGIAGRPRACGAGHHRLSASANGSKIGIGITVGDALLAAVACPDPVHCVRPLVRAWAAMRAGGLALVRAATRRSLRLSPARPSAAGRPVMRPFQQVSDRVGEFFLGRIGPGRGGCDPRPAHRTERRRGAGASRTA